MKRTLSNRKGAAMVEFAIVSLLLFTLLFGIIEFGMIIKDHLTLSQAAREGARAAALRGDVSSVEQRVKTSAPGFSTEQSDQITVTPSYRTYNPDTGWSGWTEDALPAANVDYDPGVQVQVKVEATYPHPTIVGPLLGLGDEITLSGKMVMRRE